ncbi:hypothetical protein [Arthrobacter sp. SDTb3-6]|uniref:hypothetical protein n=1 Tax=Arthrobacter sp. SDTb3-6 TaxID=2713571 RepID=UPI00159D56C8|nr:hypothetical protein [Arthrobacter sp. SDTb3-6]NVM99037.1 hypothetical protein [Arthrobacter sp. SDTb3-6]
MDSTIEGTEPGHELVFSTYGHVLGLANGVLFGAGQPARRPQVAVAAPKARLGCPDGGSGQGPGDDAPVVDPPLPQGGRSLGDGHPAPTHLLPRLHAGAPDETGACTFEELQAPSLGAGQHHPSSRTDS